MNLDVARTAIGAARVAERAILSRARHAFPIAAGVRAVPLDEVVEAVSH
jgi:hypothetical protein